MSNNQLPISGAIHYFRVHQDLWDDRLDKAVDFGLDTVETYIAWNGHEPHRGEYNFSGMYDIEEYIRKCAAHGLKVILRPGPYICAEWDNGGFPGWLLAVPGLRLRCMNEPYLKEVERWFDVLLPKLRPFMADMGGPVIYIQLENEYGSYGNDTEYMLWIKEQYLKHGITGEFITSDGPGGYWAAGGLVPGVFGASNFGSDPDGSFEAMRVFRPEGPDFCMEFWDGWFDHWGEQHHIRPRKDGKNTVAPDVENILKRGAGMNFYMFHGGTNFALTAGANGNRLEDYSATITSYDYDAPLTECGDPTEVYYECRELMRKYRGRGGTGIIPPSRKIAPEAAKFTGFAPMSSSI
ncbi:MAG: beta-galactosidase, partial [Victivallales bacterium]|nr:beta-galactosidase [Victivallales bacterium]